MKTLKGQKGIASWVVLVALIVAAVIAANVGASYDENPDSSDILADQVGGMCPTKCAWFTQKTCGQGDNNRTVGLCFFLWSCTYDHPAPCE